MEVPYLDAKYAVVHDIITYKTDEQDTIFVNATIKKDIPRDFQASQLLGVENKVHENTLADSLSST